MRALALLALTAAAAAGDAKQEAWFAFLAGEKGEKDAVPRLVQLLEDPGARRWALDALIRLEGKVPAEGVANLFQEYPEETLILLAQDPKANEEHLATIAEASVDRERYHHWLAACNLLAAQKSKRLAGPLLRDLKLKLEIWVMDRGRHGGRGEGYYGSFTGSALRGADPQWPPVPHYTFCDEQGQGAVPFAAGRKTVYYVRQVQQPGPRGSVRKSVRHMGESGRQKHRVDYLADLLEVEPWTLGFSAEDVANIQFVDAETYPRDVAAARERVAKAYGDAVRKLVERQLLKPEEAPEGPQIAVTVKDRRKDPSVALPVLDEAQLSGKPPGAAGK